ncbi:MAG: nucleoside deaminase [Deltaproteobacteria bacterium]|nr:MAG: nucleoside deaminase [Deltaproteobacteria bacterium]
MSELSPIDRRHLDRAIGLALQAEADGNLPVGAVIAAGDTVFAEAKNRVLRPRLNPGGHAETLALRQVEPEAWQYAAEMTCYTTLEPCIMCTGSLLLHGIRRVVFGAFDVDGGGRFVLPHLPPYYAPGTMSWIGPAAPARCDPLYHRVLEHFERLPFGGP